MGVKLLARSVLQLFEQNIGRTQPVAQVLQPVRQVADGSRQVPVAQLVAAAFARHLIEGPRLVGESLGLLKLETRLLRRSRHGPSSVDNSGRLAPHLTSHRSIVSRQWGL